MLLVARVTRLDKYMVSTYCLTHRVISLHITNVHQVLSSKECNSRSHSIHPYSRVGIVGILKCALSDFADLGLSTSCLCDKPTTRSFDSVNAPLTLVFCDDLILLTHAASDEGNSARQGHGQYLLPHSPSDFVALNPNV